MGWCLLHPKGLSRLLLPGPGLCLPQAPSSFPGTPAFCPGLITVPFVPQPEDLEAPKNHHFKVKTFKKVKPCGICRQVITREGCTCKGEQRVGRLGGRGRSMSSQEGGGLGSGQWDLALPTSLGSWPAAQCTSGRGC